MQRLTVVILFGALLLAGCSKDSPQDPRSAAPRDEERPHPILISDPADRKLSIADGRTYEAIVSNIAAPTKQQQYDAALLDALNLLAKGDRAGALAALETARGILDTPEIQQQIERIRTALAQQNAAKRTVQDIRAVLAAGDAQQASQLAQLALQQYGGCDAAAELTLLKQQADALVVAPGTDNVAKRTLFLQDADAALKDNNLRNAVLCYEQVLNSGEDPAVRKKLTDVRDALARYDDNRRRAAELRRDPANLEDALTAFQEAHKAWDTPQVREEIDECSLALQKRRDRLSVSDFEVRGDVGAPQAGKTVAENLLPAFKSRFDLVEREQIGKVLSELKLEAGVASDTAEGRDALTRLAKVRYLVVGSITPQEGVTVQARLVDVRSGLIVQTARLSAPSLDALMPRLPQVAQVLMMSDDQKLAFEQQFAVTQVAVKPIEIVNAPPPPLAEIAPNVPPPPPIVTYTPAPPAFGGIVIEDFRRLPPIVVETQPPPAIEIVLRKEDPRRQRLFQLSLELGDNLIRRGRPAEAQRHFQVALTLAVDHRDVDIRLERCKQLLPPPPPQPVVVVAAPPVRPRLAVFNFYINAQPGLVPPATDSWAADSFAAYCGSRFEMIDRGEVCWFMGRLGITMKEVLSDAGARVALAQALNARYFVFGAMVQTHSFDVTTDMLDAQSGAHLGQGMIHVQDHNEMKLRMNELFNQLNLPPEQQAKAVQQSKDGEKALNDIRKLQQAGQYDRAAAAAREALKANPSSVALQQLQTDNERLAEQARLAEARKKEEQRRAAEQKAAQEREQKLAKQAEQARLLAEAQAKATSEATRRNQEAAKKQAYEQFLARGRDAMKRNDYSSAVQAFQSATALVPSDEGSRELAQAKAKVEQATHERVAQEKAQREAQAKKERDAALARVETERKQRETEEAARHKAQQERDAAEYQRLLGQAKQALAKQQYDAARSAVSAARLIKAGPEVDTFQRQIQEEQASADAKKKTEQARLDEEKRQAETKKRQEAERAQRVKDLVAGARRGIDTKNFKAADQALAEAVKVAPTDPTVVKAQQDLAVARKNAEAKAAQDVEAKKRDEFNKLLAQGQTALAAKRYADAVKAYTDASQLYPSDAGAQKALKDAKAALDASKAPPPPNPKAEYDKEMTAGANFEKQKKWTEAVAVYKEALKHVPGDARAVAAQKNAQFQVFMTEGQKLAALKKFPDAAKQYEEALKLFPDNKDAKDALKRAKEGKP